MKKIIVSIMFSCVCLCTYSQEIILSDEVKEMRKEWEVYYQLINLAEKNANVADSVIYVVEKLMVTGNENVKKIWYRNFADLLARYEYYAKAIHYYDLAFQSKEMTEEEFLYAYRKKWFAKDTLLYQQKCAEYLEKSATQFTPAEMKIRTTIKEILAADQMARNYYMAFPSEQKITEHNLIIYVDTINKRKIIELFKKYPEIGNPLALDPWSNLLLGRHLFTAYPDFWLDYFEPFARKSLLEGREDAQSYARTYDRTIITSGREPYSYYGEWDNDGKNINPDSTAVNRRRVNIGLPLLENKPKNENKFFITY